MDYIEHDRDMWDALRDHSHPIYERYILDPNISQEKLEKLYSQMASILL